ncbi:SGNH/GDSL hydrolase family protein [Fibrella sp. ES10-3-2-2]|nr:hypothetical protein A6C57_00405 [Fibrella sp. ES10-3-2-2]
MKYLLISLLSFLSCVSFAQKPLPVSGTVAVGSTVYSTSRSVEEIEDRISRECHSPTGPAPSAATFGRVKKNAGESASALVFTVTPGTILYKPRFIVTADRPVNYSGTLYFTGAASNYNITSGGGSAAGGTTLSVAINIPKAGGSAEVLLPQKLYDGAKLTLFGQYADTTTTASIMPTLTGSEYTNDENWGAKHVILNIGDSQAGANAMGNDAAGARYLGHWHYSFVLRDSLRANGYSVQLVNRHLDGGTSTQLVDELKTGKFDHLNPSLIIVHIGFNDATSSSTSTTIANLNWIDAWRTRIWKASLAKPDMANRPIPKLLLVSPPPTDKSPQVTNLPAYRTAMAALANSAKAIFYWDPSTVISLNATATADVNYAATERTTGNRVHLSGIASSAEGTGMWNYTKSQSFFTLW